MSRNFVDLLCLLWKFRKQTNNKQTSSTLWFRSEMSRWLVFFPEVWIISAKVLGNSFENHLMEFKKFKKFTTNKQQTNIKHTLVSKWDVEVIGSFSWRIISAKVLGNLFENHLKKFKKFTTNKQQQTRSISNSNRGKEKKIHHTLTYFKRPPRPVTRGHTTIPHLSKTIYYDQI